MNSMIYNPQEEYDSKFRSLHASNTEKFFDALVLKSGVDVEENRKTVKEYDASLENLKKLKRKLNLWRFLRVLMIITLILIPLVILKITPKIRGMRKEIEEADKRTEELLSLAERQMAPLNALFTDEDALRIIEGTIPSLSFAPCFSAEQEMNMTVNFDFEGHNNREMSTLDLLAGHYNENPFLFENRLIHEMGVEIYHGYKTIHWTERYRGSDGKMHTRTRSQTLHATVTKPKPFYRTQVLLHYCAQGGPELSFTRDASRLHEKSEKEIDRYVKKGEKKLKRMTDDAIKENRDFVSMSNSDFEVLFDALDRTNEVQFRSLFTPLAQTNMVDLIRSQTGYGDDFHFVKNRRTNRIVTEHSQGRELVLRSGAYPSYSYDQIRENFTGKNADYFKAVYFDFAPLWAVPIYQERPVHSLDPLPDYAQMYSYKESEALANRMRPSEVVHPRTKTRAILKSSLVSSREGIDEVALTAFSYDIMKRVDFVPMLGGDGRLHSVPVPWDDYIPLEANHNFFVAASSLAENRSVTARRSELCMFR